jgi:hypothetical protein
MESTDQRGDEPAWRLWVLVSFADKGNYTTVDPKQWVEKRFEEQVKHIKYKRQESR